MFFGINIYITKYFNYYHYDKLIKAINNLFYVIPLRGI